MSYSQNSEESFILDFFEKKEKGKFIDIGAFHVFQFSNTRALYEKGWGGVLVEPAPSNYKAIADHYKDEPRIEVLNVAIGETTGEIDFYESGGDAVGTSDEKHMKKWGDAGVKYTKIKVPQVSVEEFFYKHIDDTDFISIDTEATNMAIFRVIPDYVFWQIKLFIIEHDNCQKEIEDHLERFGFTTLYMNSENILLGKV